MGDSFREALMTFSIPEKERILENFNNWRAENGLHSRIGRNIFEENNYPETRSFKKILEIFLGSGDYLNIYLDLCEDISFQGRDIDKSFRPKIVGKVILRSSYHQLLKDIYRLDDDDIREFLYLLSTCHPDYKKKYGHILLSKEITWVTWDENNLKGDPFHFIRNIDADNGKICMVLCHNLGLHHMQIGLIHTSFTYDLDETHPLKVPTTIDAGDYEYFQPSSSDSKHGLTLNYPHRESKLLGIDKYSIRPRPEGIHSDLLIDNPVKVVIQDFH